MIILPPLLQIVQSHTMEVEMERTLQHNQRKFLFVFSLLTPRLFLITKVWAGISILNQHFPQTFTIELDVAKDSSTELIPLCNSNFDFFCGFNLLFCEFRCCFAHLLLFVTLTSPTFFWGIDTIDTD